MYNRRYDKIFIMLRQELNGFSIGQQPAWGSCMIELKNKKGKLFVTVQGLKKLTDNRVYECFVIGGKANAMRGISCGNIFIDQHGKWELKWVFNPDAIGESCFCIEQLHTVAILVKGGYGLTAPLAGYFQEKVTWQKYFQEEKKKTDLRAAEAILMDVPAKEDTQKKQEQKETTKTIQEKENRKPLEEIPQQKEKLITIEEVKKEEEREKIQKKEEPSTFQKNFKNMLFQFKKELEELEEKGILTEKDQKRIEQAGKRNKEEETEKQQQSFQEENKEIVYILKNNDDIYPFEEKDCWKSIALEELAVLPLDAVKMMHHCFFILAYRKYKHFIFQKTGEKEYRIGIPSQYEPSVRREAEQLLFDTFQPCKQEVMKIGCYGYWLRKIKQ